MTAVAIAQSPSSAPAADDAPPPAEGSTVGTVGTVGVPYSQALCRRLIW
jgi:hypothetical protein